MAPAGKKKLAAAANLANLLPTGTVLAFQAFIPSFSNNGSCLPAHRYLTLSIITCFSLICFLSSFTDSFIHNDKVYYGIAGLNRLYLFNQEDNHVHFDEEKTAGEVDHVEIEELCKERGIRRIDFVHAISSLLVFLVFATNDYDVQHCFFPHATPNGNAVMMNLPLAVGAGSSFIFMLFPTTRRGIGYADSLANKK
ncbi:hypothetical protein Ddye_028372 [Dipteronia dyeriana]|uniref:Uncharacterized protein n=1 Tax=Dipteronia dyeriana TaxID=168575 RepID=A0AAD9WS99_9ROSI|nr:hypothetical protein Ddye_028372 [Dipteronia dyeriana]